MHTSGRALRVLHFAKVINRHDFIDTVVRWADPARFEMMACTLSRHANIEHPAYAGQFADLSLEAHGRLRYPGAVTRLARILRQRQIDILHAHHFEEALLAVAAARWAGGCRVVVGRHYHDEIYLLTRWAKRAALLGAEALVHGAARRIVVPSSIIRRLLLERQGLPADKVTVIPYGFDFEAQKYRPADPAAASALRRELGLGDGLLVGNFGRHHALKGQDYLLRAFAEFAPRCPEATLLMVGDGPRHAALKQLAAELGLLTAGRVVFTGWRQDAWRLLEAVDAVVHPTLHEALPQLMVEAMSKGRPLAITDVAGACDHARHLDNAFLLRQRDVSSIVEALTWIAQYRQEAARMGTRARQYVLSELPIQKIIPRFEALYEEVAWRPAA